MTQIVTPVGEVAFPYVFRPQKPMEAGKDPQYQITLVWSEDNDKLNRLEEAIVSVATSKWGPKAKQMLEKGQLRSPLRPGSDRPDTEWLEGKKFLTARSTDKPEVVDANGEDIISATEIYGGSRGRADVYLYAYDKNGNKGVAAILSSFQKTGDGERKGGRRSASEAFDDPIEDDNLM